MAQDPAPAAGGGSSLGPDTPPSPRPNTHARRSAQLQPQAQVEPEPPQQELMPQPQSGRPRRAAAQGVQAAAQAVLAHGMPASALSPPRPAPRRAAAAGVEAAAQAVVTEGMPTPPAAAVPSLAGGPQRAQAGAGATLLDLAAAAEVAEAADDSPAPDILPAHLEKARARVTAVQQRNYRRIEGQRRARGEDKDFQHGSVVYLALPAAVRDSLDPPNLLCRVMEVNNMGYCRLRCRSGILDSYFPCRELTLAPPAAASKLVFDDWPRVRGVPRVTLAAAAAAQHCGAPGVKCSCKKGCNGRCACRRAGQVCGSHCKCASGSDGRCCNFHH